MDERPDFRTHWLPRTGDGWKALLAFLFLFAFCVPPITHTLWNRVDPWILGVPFFYAVLSLIYAGLVGVLIWVYRRDL